MTLATRLHFSPNEISGANLHNCKQETRNLNLIQLIPGDFPEIKMKFHFLRSWINALLGLLEVVT